MSISRRGFLKATGASVLVLGTGGAAWVLTRSPRAALQPWEDAGGAMDDVRLQALSHAILAPNPHNRQPWQVKLVGDKAIEVRCQLDRRLPETDPLDRQITIGLGCFIALYGMAAERLGYRAKIEPFPQGEPRPRLDERPIARVTLTRIPSTRAEPHRDPLWEQVALRRSSTQPFDLARAIAPETMQRVLDAAQVSKRDGLDVGFTTETTRVERLRTLTFAAWEMEWQTQRTRMESVNLMRIGKAEINANPDGIEMPGAMPEALNRLGILTREKMSDLGSSASAQGTTMYRGIMDSAMGHMWLSTPGNSRREQLEAGAAWLRLHLAATQAGLSFHPVSQALQEYPEMASLYAQAHQELGVKTPATLQMLVRLGYGPDVPPSPRWPLQTRMLPA